MASKILVVIILLIFFNSCSVINSSYKDEIFYWQTKVEQTTIEATWQTELAYDATKNGKIDSALYYTNNGLILSGLLKQYTDSLIYYIHK